MTQRTIRDSAYRMARLAVALAIVVLLAGACDGPSRQEAEAREAALSRAEDLLAALGQGDWSLAAHFVHLDENTCARMGISADATGEEAAPRIGAWFRTIYGTVRPGSVQSVTIDPGDPTRARVSYRHDDLDGFTMRFVDGDWFYVVE